MERSTLQTLIERTVTNGRGYITSDPSRDWTRTFAEGYKREDEETPSNREMDTLDLHSYLAYTRLQSLDLNDPSNVLQASFFLSDLKTIKALKQERGQRVYSSALEVDEAIREAKSAIIETPHPLESSPLFRDCVADPGFREWCAAGFDPMYYWGPSC